MAKMKHTSLYNAGWHSDEIWEAMQSHFDRDTYFELFWVFALLGIGFLYWYRFDSEMLAWICAALFAAFKANRVATDNINRNWFMHTVDYLQHVESKRDEELS